MLSAAARSIESPLIFGKHWIPETIFLKYTELTQVVLASKASFICEFRLQYSTVQKSPCAKKAARRHICFALSGFKSRASIVRVSHA